MEEEGFSFGSLNTGELLLAKPTSSCMKKLQENLLSKLMGNNIFLSQQHLEKET